MAGHPISGPISPEELKALTDLPYGQAADVLRQHDPAWGLATPDKPIIKWEVTLTASMPVYAVVEVEAPDEDTARKMALETRLRGWDWEIDHFGGPEDVEVESAEVTK